MIPRRSFLASLLAAPFIPLVPNLTVPKPSPAPWITSSAGGSGGDGCAWALWSYTTANMITTNGSGSDNLNRIYPPYPLGRIEPSG